MSRGGEGNAFTVTLHFDRELSIFLPRRCSTARSNLSEKTSIKDIIESCGVPHTEVGAIRVNAVSVDFAHQLSSDAEVFVEHANAPNEQCCNAPAALASSLMVILENWCVISASSVSMSLTLRVTMIPRSCGSASTKSELC